MRALLASTIAWHHFLIYGPLADQIPSGSNFAVVWLRSYRWVVPAFFVISGYVLARGMWPVTWHRRQVGSFVIHRYCRLGLPYLAAIALALIAGAVGRSDLPTELIGPLPSLPQLLAHAVFLLDILHFPSVSAGLWFVCIDFQLGLLVVGLLYFRDWINSLFAIDARRPGAIAFFGVGWVLAIASLFYFNIDTRFDVWAVYYFAYFYMGVLVAMALHSQCAKRQFMAYLLVITTALAYSWRWRIVIGAMTAAGLFFAARSGIIERWPSSRLVAYLGRTSYSLFLVHYPVLILVEVAWVRCDWQSHAAAIAGLIVAYSASLAVADVFYRLVERPTAKLSHRFT